MDRRKMTSALNGKKSNGPVSREGKYWSSKNALKHGLCSADLHLTIGENKKEFKDFITEGLKHYRPFDFYTQEIFERMMHQLWKLKLIPKIESGIAAYEMQTYEAEDYKTKRAELIQHADFEEQDQQKVKYQNLLLGIAFLKDANSGNAFLKLSNYETKLLSNFFQLEKIYLNYKEKNMDEKISSIKKDKKIWFDKNRKTKFCQTNLNNRYFNKLLKKKTEDFLKMNGETLKENNPGLYYSIKNKPLPKKYQKPSYPIAPVNAYVPEQSKLSKEELDLQVKQDLELKKEKEAKALAAKQKKEKEIALENYRQRLRKEVSAIYVCRPQDNHRWVSVSSDAYQNRYKKKYEYY